MSAFNPRRWRALGAAWALAIPAVLLLPDRAKSHFVETTQDWVGHKRELCYRLMRGEQLEKFKGTPTVKNPDIGDDARWRGWIDEAIKTWNDKSKQTGWSLRPCKEDEKADVVFRFDYESATTRNKGGATTTDFHQQTLDHLTVWIRESFTWSTNPQGHIVENKDFAQDKDKKAVNPTGGYKGSGWGRTGETTMDPVLVVTHELTHVMRLDHSETHPINTGSYEESIAVGIHSMDGNGLQPSKSDLTELKRSSTDQGQHSTGGGSGSKDNISFVTGWQWSRSTDKAFVGHDELANPPDDSRALPGSTSSGQIGFLFSNYRPLLYQRGSETYVEWFFRTGFLWNFSNKRTDSVERVSRIPQFEGEVTDPPVWQIPLLLGVAIPLNGYADNPGGLIAEVFGGAQVSRRRASFVGNERGAAAGQGVSASADWTSVDPAVGFGLRYGLGIVDTRQVSVGVGVTFDWSASHSVLAQSPNFASETYTLNTGRQMDTSVLLSLTMGLGRSYK